MKETLQEQWAKYPIADLFDIEEISIELAVDLVGLNQRNLAARIKILDAEVSSMISCSESLALDQPQIIKGVNSALCDGINNKAHEVLFPKHAERLKQFENEYWAKVFKHRHIKNLLRKTKRLFKKG